jgi:pimeloyl-ACP methyl ester carboxylesterase
MTQLVADISGSGPAVVLLHGQPGARSDWARVTRRLGDQFRIVAPDRPGYGDTGGRARGFRANGSAVVDLLDRLGIERATIVGYSWAGGVALALAEHAPDRVDGLVLVSSVGPGDPPTRLDRMLAVPPIGSVLTVAGLLLASGAVSIPPLRRALNGRRSHSTATPAAVTAASTAAADDSPDGWGAEAVLRSWRGNRVWESFVTEQQSLIDDLPLLAPRLGAIDVPTVVLVGQADRVVPPATGRRLAACIPGARLVEVAGAGHLLAFQHPDEVAAAVRDVAAR